MLAGAVAVGLAVSLGAFLGEAPVCAKAGQASNTQPSSIESRSLCDMKASLKNGQVAPFAVARRHVRLPLFAVIVCRKFAIETAMFWHLPRHTRQRSRGDA